MEYHDLTDDEDFAEFINITEENIRRKSRVFRDRPNHFEKWSDDEFFDRFRLTKPTVQDILNQLNIGPQTTR